MKKNWKYFHRHHRIKDRCSKAYLGNFHQHLSDLGYHYLYDNASLTVGDLTIENNIIDQVSGYGVWADWNETYLEDSSTGSWGSVSIVSNTVDARSGVELDPWVQGSYSDTHFSFGDINILNNTISDTGSPYPAIGIWDMYVEKVTDGQIDIGTISISGNEILAGQNGIYFYGGIEHIYDTNVNVGDFIITGNDFLNLTGEGMTIDYYDVYDLSGTSVCNYGHLYMLESGNHLF